MHRDEWDDEDEEPKWAGAPLTTKEKDMLRYYYYIHNGIDTRYVVKTHSAPRSGVNANVFLFNITLVISLMYDVFQVCCKYQPTMVQTHHDDGSKEASEEPTRD